MEKRLFEEVKKIVVTVLRLDGNSTEVASINEMSGLMGDRPEFDSASIVQLLTAIEDHYDIEIDDDEIEGEMFLTFGTLCSFVKGKLAQ